jgi:hypothetical protein
LTGAWPAAGFRALGETVSGGAVATGCWSMRHPAMKSATSFSAIRMVLSIR